MQGEPSAAPQIRARVQDDTRVSIDVLAALKAYCDTLQLDGGSSDTWIGLSEVFAQLDDPERVRRCRHVAALLA